MDSALDVPMFYNYNFDKLPLDIQKVNVNVERKGDSSPSLINDQPKLDLAAEPAQSLRDFIK
jgi:hypothetical protein